MRVELPEGYVPPQPTHPHYGYLTPQERAELEASEREPVEPTRAATEPETETRPRPTGWVPPPPSPPAAED